MKWEAIKPLLPWLLLYLIFIAVVVYRDSKHEDANRRQVSAEDQTTQYDDVPNW